ncbi:(2Fe-2S) ferredoxin domain-containing protein [Sphingomonas sp. SUN019]|nr:(2Fe-2S) ferredoxin domain-containing protein [Sphingomonas sp. SUN019]UVO52568.1 (2Fe-2S) ferredoxin domain-containing protein [Sphingomonas sp. SUN019]
MKLAKSHWHGCVLVCGKCSKKLDGGFGPKGRTPLAKALSKQDGFGRKRKAAIGVVETKCLGLCPKRAVTVVDTRGPERWLVVPEATDAVHLAQLLRHSRESGNPSPTLSSGEPAVGLAMFGPGFPLSRE